MSNTWVAILLFLALVPLFPSVVERLAVWLMYSLVWVAALFPLLALVGFFWLMS